MGCPHQGYESLSGRALAAAAGKVPWGRPPGLRQAVTRRAAGGCLHAAAALEKHLMSSCDVMYVGDVDPMVVQACHDAGLRSSAALLYDRLLREDVYPGAYSRSLTVGFGLVVPASVLGDNVEAWKLFYSLSEDNPVSPMEAARTAVPLVGE